MKKNENMRALRPDNDPSLKAFGDQYIKEAYCRLMDQQEPSESLITRTLAAIAEAEAQPGAAVRSSRAKAQNPLREVPRKAHKPQSFWRYLGTAAAIFVVTVGGLWTLKLMEQPSRQAPRSMEKEAKRELAEDEVRVLDLSDYVTETVQSGKEEQSPASAKETEKAEADLAFPAVEKAQAAPQAGQEEAPDEAAEGSGDGAVSEQKIAKEELANEHSPKASAAAPKLAVQRDEQGITAYSEVADDILLNSLLLNSNDRGSRLELHLDNSEAFQDEGLREDLEKAIHSAYERNSGPESGRQPLVIDLSNAVLNEADNSFKFELRIGSFDSSNALIMTYYKEDGIWKVQDVRNLE